MARDYVPQNAVKFHSFTKHLISYVEERMDKWGHIPVEAKQMFIKDFDDYAKAFELTISEHTRSQILARNEAKEKCVKTLRKFVNQYLRFEPVTNVDRTVMGIPNHDSVRTVRKEVTETISFDIRLRGISELVVHFQQAGVSHKARPEGYDGAIVIWHIADTVPSQAHQFSYHAKASRTPFIIKFNDEDRGKKAWITLCWQNKRGNRGIWSEIKSSIIP